ncbi:hypothetical protein BU16DRAFT_560444 [Lophium mytilinum]|uniref:Uncharacterized protein n=1 Tax=Lophium mytilinum TaxID=390894 RepID=A0A6A6QYD5_9PEZI|nr:hypothetical protein BU16DRAFT_560444 [Lophium mytilinum]
MDGRRQSSPTPSLDEKIDSGFVLLSNKLEKSNLNDDAKHVPKSISVNVNDAAEVDKFIAEHGKGRWLNGKDCSARVVELKFGMMQFINFVLMSIIAILLTTSAKTPRDPTAAQPREVVRRSAWAHLDVWQGRTACTSICTYDDSLGMNLTTSCDENLVWV